MYVLRLINLSHYTILVPNKSYQFISERVIITGLIIIKNGGASISEEQKKLHFSEGKDKERTRKGQGKDKERTKWGISSLFYPN